jgi:hypothetical protein
LVPVAAVSLFFVLRECRQNLPPAATAAEPADPKPADPEAAPPTTPAPQ